MIYSAEIMHLSDEIEEEVVLRINGVEVTCFASICPFQINERATYQVALTPIVSDEYSVREVSRESQPSLMKVGVGFAYDVVGELIGNQLNAGCIVLEDDVLLRDYGYLDRKMIVWRVDRIDVEILCDKRGQVQLI